MSTISVVKERRVVVVGSGLAGLSAASQLVAHGIIVHMLERATKPGGNSIKASWGISGAPTKYQPGPPFSDSSFYADTIKSAGKAMGVKKKERDVLISTLMKGSAEAVEWLVSKDVDLSAVAQLGGHGFPRTHRGASKTPPGTNCVVTKVLHTSIEVHRVKFFCENEKKVANGPVIFATGGFAGDAHGLLAQYCPDLTGFPSTNGLIVGSQPLLTNVGAQLLDMDLVQVHPTSFVDPKDSRNPVKFLAAELLRGEGGLMLFEGKRFINKMETRKNVTSAITSILSEEMMRRQWNVVLVLDERVYQSTSSHIDFYIWKGLMRKGTVGELGSKVLGMIKAYADATAGRESDPFGREYFGYWELTEATEDSVVYVGRVTPAVHFTMDGVVKGRGFGCRPQADYGTLGRRRSYGYRITVSLFKTQ